MATKHKRENCDNKIREIIVDMVGNKVVLSGKYAFEWTITKYTKDAIIETTFKCRKDAQKEFKRLKNHH